MKDEEIYAIKTPFGDFGAVFSNIGLRRFMWPGTFNKAVFSRYRFSIQLQSELQEYFSGAMVPFQIPLDFSGYTEFQILVWEELLRIKFGEVKTYGEIAAGIGKPGASRAVGNACGKNPLPLVVPCHRVVSSVGLGGFSGDMEWKKKLLAHEKVLTKVEKSK